MVGVPRARRAPLPRARRGPSVLSLLILAGCAVAVLLPALAVRGWLGPAGHSGAAEGVGEGVGERVGTALHSEGQVGRRELWRGSAAAGAAGLWASSPEAAEAFRNDRILNAKKAYVPSIRYRYQMLEGLRDDLYLTVELESGNADSRVRIPARPADWFSGRDSSLDGPLMIVTDEDGASYGCQEMSDKVKGAVVLIARGRCTFYDKMMNAQAAGAKAVIMYDQKMSKQPLETQGKTGAVRSKGVATREAGDALTGGVAILPYERGKTIMGVDKDQEKPKIDAAMVGLANGTTVADAVREGKQPRILDVTRFKFEDGIDAFIKRDLKKLLNEMEIFGNTMRVSKDDMGDPILAKLKTDRKAFAAAVKSKDYGEIQRTFAAWNENLDKLGSWDLQELY